MKSAISTLFFPLLVCVYLGTIIGFEVHTCGMEGVSRVTWITKENTCSCCCCADHTVIKDCCGNAIEQEEDMDNHCCETSVYILDNVHNVTISATTKAAPAVVLDAAPLTASGLLFACNDHTVQHYSTVKIVHGPDGGLASITPLRL